LALVAVAVGIAALLMDRPAVVGVLVAGAVALPIQVVAFALMAKAPVGSNAFLAAWVGGALVRLVVVGVAAFVLAGLPDLPRAPTLLGLVAFFFVMLLLEPLFLGLGDVSATLEPRSR
jgi:hypothetical protein